MRGAGVRSRYSRIFYISHLLSRWGGRLSLVLYGMDDEEAKIIEYLDKREYDSRLSLLVYLVRNNTEESKTFPINALRNLGIQNSRTTHYMVTDFDVWPSCLLPFPSPLQTISTTSSRACRARCSIATTSPSSSRSCSSTWGSSSPSARSSAAALSCADSVRFSA